MIKKTLLALIVISIGHTFPNMSFAQTAGFKIGYGSYGMKDLKNIQSDVLRDVGIQSATITESFPMYFNYALTIITKPQMNRSLKFEIGMSSTGSRIAAADYSGNFRFDQLALQYYFQVGQRYYIKRYQNNTQSFIEWNSGYSYSSVEFITSLTLSDQNTKDNVDLVEHSAYVQPLFGISIPANQFILEPYIGFYYDIYFSGLALKENNDAKLNNGERDLHAYWRGFRFGFNVLLQL